MLEQSAAGALESLVQRPGNLRRNRTEPHPLSLGRAHFLLDGSPPGLLGFGSTCTTGHRIGRQPLAQLLRQKLGR